MFEEYTGRIMQIIGTFLIKVNLNRICEKNGLMFIREEK